MPHSLGFILRSAEGRWLEILRTLAGSELREALAIHPSTRHCECPVHGGENGDAFRLFEDANKSGGGTCNSCGAKANGIFLLSWLFNWSQDRAIEEVAKVLGIEERKPRKTREPREPKEPRKAEQASTATATATATATTSEPPAPAPVPKKSTNAERRERLERRERWHAILRNAYPASESPLVAAYFAARGLPQDLIQIPDTLRFDPALPYYDNHGNHLGDFPAIVARVNSTRTKADAGLVNIHRTYLDPNPETPQKLKLPNNLPARKLEVPEDKGGTSGGAVQLYPLPKAKNHNHDHDEQEGPITLAITEGIENALAVHAATGLPAWAATSAPMLASWNYADKARSVEIWADHDEAGLAAANKLADNLAAQHFRVKIIIPPVPGQDWLDVWDHGRGKSAMIAAQAAAEVINPPTPDDLREYGAETDPHRLAHVFLARHSTADHEYRIRYFRQAWWRWIGTKYVEIDDDTFRAEVTTAIKAEFDRLHALAVLAKKQRDKRAGGSDSDAKESTKEPARNHKERDQQDKEPVPHKVSLGIINNVIEVTKSLVLVDSSNTEENQSFPRWLGEPPAPLNPADRNWFSFTNALISIDGIIRQSTTDNDLSNTIETMHTPKWFSPIAAPYAYEPFDTARCDKWDAFLQTNLEGDQERIAILQEWFGLCLVNDTSYQKFLILEGEGANGKSVICAALEAMLGSANVSHVPPDKFGDRFSLHGTLGKLANIVAEVGELDKIAEGTIKAFTSGDPMAFERKHKDPFDALPTARLIFATNNKPRFSDRSSGIWRRILFIPMRVQIPEEKRSRGMDKPQWWTDSGELPGIFVWACEGLARLREQGGFTKSAIMDEAMEDYRSDSNPARQFLIDNYEGNMPDEIYVTVSEIYTKYREWCKECGYHPMSDRVFGREVFRVFPKSKRIRKSLGEDRKWAYSGIAESRA